MNNKIPDIILIYPSTFSDEKISEETSELFSSGLNLKIQKEENKAFSAFEWIIPTAFGMYILKPFFDAFLSEAGKDFYLILKKNLKKFVEKGKQYNYRLITASQSTNKLSADYNQSITISLVIETKNKRHIKLLFNNDLEKEDWDYAIDQILDYVIDNYENYPEDKLSKRIYSINDNEKKVIYGQINPDSKLVEFFDDNMLFSKYKNNANK